MDLDAHPPHQAISAHTLSAGTLEVGEHSRHCSLISDVACAERVRPFTRTRSRHMSHAQHSCDLCVLSLFLIKYSVHTCAGVRTHLDCVVP